MLFFDRYLFLLKHFQQELLTYFVNQQPDVIIELENGKDLSDELRKRILKTADAYLAIYNYQKEQAIAEASAAKEQTAAESLQ